MPAAPGFWLIAALVGAAGFGVSFLLFNTVIAQVDAGRWPMRDPRSVSPSITGITR